MAAAMSCERPTLAEAAPPALIGLLYESKVSMLSVPPEPLVCCCFEKYNFMRSLFFLPLPLRPWSSGPLYAATIFLSCPWFLYSLPEIRSGPPPYWSIGAMYEGPPRLVNAS